MDLRKYVVPVGSWVALCLGLLYLVVFFLTGGHGNLAIAISFFALSLSIKAYGHSQEKALPRRKRA